jgi:signal transduction histidine kinase
MHGRECRKARSAQRATVIARVEDRALRVEVRDNGARPDGSGLVGMADRLSVIDGRLRVESPVGGGTLVSAHIPLPE